MFVYHLNIYKNSHGVSFTHMNQCILLSLDLMDFDCCSLQGLTYDHVELNFRLNGKPVNTTVNGIKGTVYPVFYGMYFYKQFFILVK